MTQKLVIAQNDRAISALEMKSDKVRTVIQNVVSEFKSKGITVENVSQLSDMLDRNRVLIPDKLEELVCNEIYPDTPKGMNREKYLQLVQMPELGSLYESMENLNGYFGSFDLADSIDWNLYTIENGEVIVIPEELEKLKMAFMDIAETAIEKKRLAIVTDVCKALNQLIAMATDEPANYNLAGVANFSEKSKQFEPSERFVKEGSIDSKMIFSTAGKPQSLKSSPSKHVTTDFDATDETISAAAMAKARN